MENFKRCLFKYTETDREEQRSEAAQLISPWTADIIPALVGNQITGHRTSVEHKHVHK